ncbi:hypothetical protein L1887_02995 [Cichorium endivia]|nr:hypothetical protein L1887_02995 [Cichorium endivia]
MSDYLCEELIIKIFKRLPPKSLLRFRSLSKSWYSCISSPDFIRKHTLQSPQKLLIRHRTRLGDFCTLDSQDKFGISVKFPYDKQCHIVGLCNGVLCLVDLKENRISLWNPSIRRKLTLPGCPRTSSYMTIGFGFDPITDDYKIVSVFNKYGSLRETSYVYNRELGYVKPRLIEFNAACIVEMKMFSETLQLLSI